MTGTPAVSATGYPTTPYSYPMYGDDMMGFDYDNSIFNTPYGGMAMPYMNNGTYDPSKWFDYQRQYMRFQRDYNLENMQYNREYELSANAPFEAIKNSAMLLNNKIVNNEQSQIHEVYMYYLDKVKALYPNASELEVRARASTLYEQVTGTPLVADIQGNSRGSFAQGFLSTLTFGLVDKRTGAENIAEMTGTPVGRQDKVAKTAGRFAGGAAIGATAGLILGPIGAIAGGIIGGLIGCFTGKGPRNEAANADYVVPQTPNMYPLRQTA